MNARVPVVAYVWRTWEHICDYVPLVAYVCMAYVPGMTYLGVVVVVVVAVVALFTCYVHVW